jgi:2Fe-2S ferredoxin
MPTIIFVDPHGNRRQLTAEAGRTLLDIGQANGLAMEGACEGSMACSTCHVIVDPAWYDRLPAAAPEEEDMLDLCLDLTATSRLGCQLVVTGELDGLVVSLPAETHNLMI